MNKYDRAIDTIKKMIEFNQKLQKEFTGDALRALCDGRIEAYEHALQIVETLQQEKQQ